MKSGIFRITFIRKIERKNQLKLCTSYIYIYILIHAARVIIILWGCNMLLHLGAKDQHVERSSWVGQPPHLHPCPLVTGGHGGAPNCPCGAQEGKP